MIFSVMLSKKSLFIFLMTLLYVVVIARLVEWTSVAGALAKLSKVEIAVATLLVIFANLMAFVRSRAVIKTLGFTADWKSIFVAFAAGSITNLSLNVVGQSLTRAIVLERAGVPFGVSVIATYIERFLAAGFLFFFSLLSAWYLFGQVTVDFEHGVGKLMTSIVGIVIVAGAVALSFYREQLRQSWNASGRWLFRFWDSALFTLASHAAGLGAYLVLITAIDPREISMALVAALTIVMFVTSLPISFAGFGLRELSAASTLGVIGISSGVAVAAALIIGLLYLLVTGAFNLLSLAIVAHGRRRYVAEGPTRPLHPEDSFSTFQQWDVAIVRACVAICAVLIFFRIQLQIGVSATPVNINAADIVVFAAFSIVGLMMFSGRLSSVLPFPFVLVLAVLSGVIAIGLLTSYSLHNLGNWALYTRGFGWLLMLGYALLGATMVKVAGDAGRWLIVQSLVVAAATICAIQLVLLFWTVHVAQLPGYVIYPLLQGYANNQNAFCFDLAMTGIMLVVIRNRGFFDERAAIYVLIIVLFATTIYFTGSRTGTVLIILLAMFDWFTAYCLMERRPTPGPAAMVWAAAVVVAATLLPHTELLDPIIALIAGPQGAAPAPIRGFIHAEADIERWATVVGGMQLWSERPLLGAGIGAFVESVRRAGQSAIGIHSIYVWFLAEMGIMGFIVLLASGGVLFRKSIAMMRVQASIHNGTALFAIVAFLAIGGLVQDFFYQRMFWFVLGLLAAVPGAVPLGGRSDRLLLSLIVGFGLLVFFLWF